MNIINISSVLFEEKLSYIFHKQQDINSYIGYNNKYYSKDTMKKVKIKNITKKVNLMIILIKITHIYKNNMKKVMIKVLLNK